MEDARAQVGDWGQKLRGQQQALENTIDSLQKAGLSSLDDDISAMKSRINSLGQQIAAAERDGARAIQTLEKAASKAKTPLPEQVAPPSENENRAAFSTLQHKLADVAKNSGIDRNQLQRRSAELITTITTSKALTPVNKARLLFGLVDKLHEWAPAKNACMPVERLPIPLTTRT